MSAPGVAVVTGASRGIGRAVAKRLAERWEVVAVARSAPELESLRAEIEGGGGRCRPVCCDVSDAAAVERALAGVEAAVLVNNAGIGVMKPLVEMSIEEWRRMMGVNLDALFYVTRTLLPGMLRRGAGHIVNIGSLAGRNPMVGGTGYTATKHAVVGFSESLMLEVRDAGVQVSMVMPGSVATDFSPRKGDTSWMISSEEIADAVWYLLHQRGNALVSRIEVRPARPPRKS
ncbi:MAG TPA: SDR family NAD(P)-dependent oxidoreductase [Gemmatimonadaceae bacterium]|nr:SDR family NAD(P)-dependent oxidoreductase [Gemmatimonadaceae bacterium]